MVHIRFRFEKNDMGLILGINAKNQVQEMFKDNNNRTTAIRIVKLTPINENEIFINRYQNDGMQDLKTKISDEGLILADDNTNFKATIKPSF